MFYEKVAMAMVGQYPVDCGICGTAIDSTASGYHYCRDVFQSSYLVRQGAIDSGCGPSDSQLELGQNKRFGISKRTSSKLIRLLRARDAGHGLDEIDDLLLFQQGIFVLLI